MYREEVVAVAAGTAEIVDASNVHIILSCTKSRALGGGVSENLESLIWGPHNKDHSILGSMLGSSCFGKLPSEA